MTRAPLKRRAVLVLLALAAALPWPAPAQSKDIVIFAAASMKNALDEANAAWAAQHGGRKAVISYAASSALAKQIEAGAPADIFISADLDWMDYVEKRGRIRPQTQTNLLGNRIVLIAPKDSKVAVELAPGVDIAGKLGGDGRLAMGSVESVPAGKYGKAALERLGAWDAVKGRIAQADNVRAAMLLVSRGEAPLGIVYRTDAAADPGVRVAGIFPEDTHPPIIYPAAVTTESTSPEAAEFLAFLHGTAARAAFERQGFSVLKGPASGS